MSIARCLVAIALLAVQGVAPARATGNLEIHDGWIRSAPPNSMMLAGYAVLRNVGDSALTISAVTADGYNDTSLHESVLVGDISRMLALDDVTIAPGDSVSFAPGGKHIMLMEPSSSPRVGDQVAIHFRLSDGSEQSSNFVVRDAAPGAGDHAGMAHPSH